MKCSTSLPPKEVPTLQGDRIILRSLRAEDIPALCRHAGHPEVSRWMPNLAYPFGEQEARDVIRRAAEQARSGDGYYFGIDLVGRKEVIGIIGVKLINWTDCHADLSFWIGQGFRRQGLTEEAVRLALRFTFRDLRLHRVSAHALAPNVASAGLLQKVGFRLEGRWRKDCFLRGRWYDAVVFGLLDREFLGRR